MSYATLHPSYASSINDESALILLGLQVIVLIAASLTPPAQNLKFLFLNTNFEERNILTFRFGTM